MSFFNANSIMAVLRVPLVVLVLVMLCSDKGSCGDEAEREARNYGYQVPSVVPVDLTEKEYKCEHNTDPATTTYTWSKQGSSSLPEGTKAEGNSLYFHYQNADQNGVYFCNITHENGTAIAVLYRQVQDCSLHWIFKKVLALCSLLM